VRLATLFAWATPRRLLLLAGFVGLCILVGNAAMTALSHGLILPNQRLVAGDFMAFWSAGHMTLQGDGALIHQGRPIYEAQLTQAPDLKVVYLWHHPPSFLLVAVVLAMVPYLWAAGLWLALTAALYAMATRAFFASPAALVFAFAAPAAAMHFGNVQTGLLTAALFGMGLLWARERPFASGAAIGLLVIKPHLAVLFPLAFVAAGRWRAIAAAALVAGGICCLSVVAFGVEAWARFFANIAHAQGLVTEQKIAAGTYAAVFANLRGLGAPVWLAAGIHGASAILAVLAVVVVWRRGPSLLAGALLASASMLISPYLFFYDLTALLVSIALIVRAVGWEALGLWERVAIAFAWIAPGLLFTLGQLVPLPFAAVAAWGLIVVAWRRAPSAFSTSSKSDRKS